MNLRRLRNDVWSCHTTSPAPGMPVQILREVTADSDSFLLYLQNLLPQNLKSPNIRKTLYLLMEDHFKSPCTLYCSDEPSEGGPHFSIDSKLVKPHYESFVLFLVDEAEDINTKAMRRTVFGLMDAVLQVSYFSGFWQDFYMLEGPCNRYPNGFSTFVRSRKTKSTFKEP